MKITVEAACGCNMGKIRKNNEDNFFYQQNCLPLENEGLDEILFSEIKLGQQDIFGVFDGIGGESCGEIASYAAATCLKEYAGERKPFLHSMEAYLNALCVRMNEAVRAKMEEYRVSQMGTTIAMLYMTSKRVYALNIGDSRIYRWKENQLTQLSKDHCAKSLNPARKPDIIQYLGLDLEEMELEPHIVHLPLESGDSYLVCSDGLTDMVSVTEIEQILKQNKSAKEIVNDFITVALENGGRDNVTVIVCKIK